MILNEDDSGFKLSPPPPVRAHKKLMCNPYGLNVSPQNSYTKIVLGEGAFRGWLGKEAEPSWVGLVLL